MTDQVEEVKRRADIVWVIGGYMTLKRGGKNYKGLCPFHGEKSPSFMVSPELQMYKCFGCGESGDVISFVEKIEGIEFVEALTMLADRVGVKLQFKGGEERSEKDKLIEIHEWAANYYHYLLTKHKVGKAAAEYLAGRKVSKKLITEFRLGYSLAAWDGLYKYLTLKKKVEERLLQKTGLIIKGGRGGYYDRFRGRVMIPLLDVRGRVIAFAGRVMPGADKEEPKYINSPETEIYHKGEALFGLYQAKADIRKNDRVVVVEGDMDMISSFGAGVGETVAIKGTALTEEQLLKLSRLTRNLILALDADTAGEAAIKRGIQMAEKLEMNTKIVVIEGGKDPDDVARENPKMWIKEVDGAKDIYQYYLESALKKFDAGSVDGKRKISEEVVPILARASNKVIQAVYVRKLSEALGVGEESVMREMERVGRGGTTEVKREEKKENRGMEVELTVEILALMLRLAGDQRTEWLKKWREKGVNGGVKAVVEELMGWKGEVAEFIKSQPEERRGLIGEAYLLEVDESRIERDLKGAINEWVKMGVKKRLEELKNLVREAERKGEGEESTKWQVEVVELMKKLKLEKN